MEIVVFKLCIPESLMYLELYLECLFTLQVCYRGALDCVPLNKEFGYNFNTL